MTTQEASNANHSKAPVQPFVVTPLSWSGLRNHEGTFETASTPFGNYRVSCDADGGNAEWSFCFEEYYDEDDFRADSLDEAKQAAWDHWLNRIKGALTPI